MAKLYDGSMNQGETLESRYNSKAQEREMYLERARDCSELTIPTLIPESGSTYAEEFSMDKVSGMKGGTLGWITRESVVENFRKVMINTKVGDVSEPFNTRFGWHILYLEDKRIKNISDNIRRNQAIAILKDRKVAVAKREWLAKLKDQAYIEYVK